MTDSGRDGFYITTPIYYVNGLPHIGTALTTVACDAIARYHRTLGEKSRLLTGTDENGAKIQDAAEQAGKPTDAFVNGLSAAFRACWQDLDVRFDDFIRTTEPRHIRAVQEFFTRLVERGFVYKDTYQGWYSTSDETFYRDTDVVDGRSKETGKPVVRVSEENYFFKLSQFGDRLLQYYEENPGFLQPEFRKNEVVGFINEGLRDICITRPNKGWGIPFPGDPSKVIYVWFDALISYLASTGWPDDPEWEKWWPADLHFMGKEIFVRFHATLWPAMLLALDIPLPKCVFAHGFWTLPGLRAGEKAGKSTGGLPHPTSFELLSASKAGIDRSIAVDALRYMLCREMNFGLDTEFSVESFLRRYNTDLANDLGNLVNRTVNMLHKFCAGIIPECASPDPEIVALARVVQQTYHEHMSHFKLNSAIEIVMQLVARMNKYIDTSAPWALAKAVTAGDTEAQAKIDTILYSCLEAARICALLLAPFMPTASMALCGQVGASQTSPHCSDLDWGKLAPGTVVDAAVPIFPRITDTSPTEAELMQIGALVNKNEEQVTSVDTTNEAVKPGTPVQAVQPGDDSIMIGIEDFMKVQLKVGEVLAAEPVPNATKLLRLTVKVAGDEARTILAGIAEYYKPEDLEGRQVVVVANLQPRKMRGIESQGMLLAADVEGRAVLVRPEELVPVGARVR